ncbi:protein SPMIP1-like [Ruditapes philippinarum]|jgi:hypothetical protein|uniref:protein SPMIP1-like n=1 Tax=Ruditapes philippinarum TaxID=129788 RepID=UPI00295B4751|nr:protein SPMIP1-like [Ruditapes philippinarum]
MASRSYPANTQIQKFLEESYLKEQGQRLTWYAKQQGRREGGKSKQFEVFRRKIENESKPEGLMARVPKGVKEPRYNKKITRTDDTLCDKSDGINLLSAEMRPVPASVTEKLYDGFTKEGKGRYQYLRKRNEMNPEDKFEFPLLNSWEYGWRLSDVIKKEEIKKPANGRTRIVADTFYTRTGIPT